MYGADEQAIRPTDIMGYSMGLFVSAVVAEWLRRLTRNQLGSARTGSNPVHCELDYFFLFITFFVHFLDVRAHSFFFVFRTLILLHMYFLSRAVRSFLFFLDLHATVSCFFILFFFACFPPLDILSPIFLGNFSDFGSFLVFLFEFIACESVKAPVQPC